MRLSRILHRWNDRPEHNEGQKRLNSHNVLPRCEHTCALLLHRHLCS
jgi:hypothetical protein